MLEVKNLRKEYKTKKGVVTKALDDVSLTFPETGMIFILGKSGSGKSTLLNVCGGLDKMDSGEIIIKGKSSKEFSSQDFDSYRNTFVGFVFQEYNILDEFTVYDNVALALELQNKKKDKAVIEKILEDVEMSAYAFRKPNTLSGGQKQRVAIARALVKSPEIIMADEPTGALDSKTGQQVFDTLKKLSKEKLVLVVSHDREFAEQYGDRIIELKDGKILSDMTRATEGEGAKNVRFFGSDTVCVADGSKITDSDLASIKKFLEKSGGAAVISTSHERISEMKQDLPEMEVGAFENIKKQPESKQYPKQKLIRSKFALRHAFKMGSSGLKSKPIRLAFTMILSIVAFILFGLASTVMLFDAHSVAVSTLESSSYQYIALGKAYHYVEKHYWGDTLDSEYPQVGRTKYTMAEYEAIAAKYPGAMAAIDFYFPTYFDNVSLSDNARAFYSTSPDGLVIANSSLEMLAGQLPAKSNEVVISDYLFDSFKVGKFTESTYNEQTHQTTQTEVTLNHYSDIIGKELVSYVMSRQAKLKITGVYKGSVVPSAYEELKSKASQNQSLTGEDAWMISGQWSQERNSGLYGYLGVTESFVTDNVSLVSGGDILVMEDYFEYSYIEAKYVNKNGNENSLSVNFISAYGANNTNKKDFKAYSFAGTELTSLPSGTVAMSSRILAELYSSSMPFDWKKSQELEQAEDQRYMAIFNPLNERRWELENRKNPLEGIISDYEFRASDCERRVNEIQTEIGQFEQERSNLQIEKANTQAKFDEEIAKPPEEQDENLLNNLRGELENKQHQIDSMESMIHSLQEPLASLNDELSNHRNNLANARDELETLQTELDGVLAQIQAADAEHAAKQEEIQALADEADKINLKISSLREGRDYFKAQVNETPYEEMEKLIEADAFLYIKDIEDYFADNNATLPKLSMESRANSEKREATVGGVYFFPGSAGGGSYYFADDLYEVFHEERDRWTVEEETKYVAPEDANISSIFIPYDNSEALTQELIAMTETRAADDSTTKILNSIMSQIDMVAYTAEQLGTIFLLVGIVLALFSFLLMFNFISASITAKKKEIGILRAIGARTLDVFKIFLSEAFIIALICFVISTVGSAGICILLNNMLMEGSILEVTLFVFGPISVAAILAITAVTAIISTVIPVALYSRKPPVASIRAL